MLADHLWTAKVRGPHALLDPQFFLMRFARIAVCGPLDSGVDRRGAFSRAGMRKEVLILGLIACSAIALHLSNYGFTDLPLMTLMAIFVIQRLPIKQSGPLLVFTFFCVFAGAFW